MIAQTIERVGSSCMLASLSNGPRDDETAARAPNAPTNPGSGATPAGIDQTDPVSAMCQRRHAASTATIRQAGAIPKAMPAPAPPSVPGCGTSLNDAQHVTLIHRRG